MKAAAHRPHVPALVSLAFALALPFSQGFAQSDDFDDNNDNGWTHLNPLTVANLSASGGQYRISSPESPNPAFGGARAAGMRQDAIYSDFCVVVDLVDFDIALAQSIGILARVQPNPGVGAVDGYSLTIQPSTNDMDISLIAGELPTAIDGNAQLSTPLDSKRTYRLVFFGIGTRLEGRLYDTDDLENPIGVATTTDATYAAGTCGLVVADLGDPEPGDTIDATFDNYVANGLTPPPLTITKDAFDEGTLFWPDHALCFKLQTTTDLRNGPWTDVTSGILHFANQNRFLVSLFFFGGTPERYWRLAVDDSGGL